MEAQKQEKKKIIEVLQEYSVFLIAGVVIAVLMATAMGEHAYHHIVEVNLAGNFTVFGHKITPHWLINDVFMVFFFGIAAKEITEAMLPGGALNPPKKALSPLLATLGGVFGPIAVFFVLIHILIAPSEVSTVSHGWGIPTATDIALAWLVARVVFGNGHPAINFLLLLAIADDAIGLIIIAVFYPDPHHPVQPIYLGLVALGMIIAFAMRKSKLKIWQAYIFGPGVISWLGLLLAGLHPALALVPIVPFLPSAKFDDGLFEENPDHVHNAPPLEAFEHSLKLFVDVGLLFFGLTNAGVAVTASAFHDPVVFVIFLALLIGKPLGITLFAFVAKLFGISYPSGLATKHIFVAGCVGALGLTVALFVAGVAYEAHPAHTGPAKMGALLSGLAAIIALIFGKIFNVKKLVNDSEEEIKTLENQ